MRIEGVPALAEMSVLLQVVLDKMVTHWRVKYEAEKCYAVMV